MVYNNQINFLNIKNNFDLSPYIFLKNNLIIKNLFLIYFFSTFLRNSNSLIFKKNNFKNFLQTCLIISKGFQYGIIEKERLSFDNSNLFFSKIFVYF